MVWLRARESASPPQAETPRRSVSVGQVPVSRLLLSDKASKFGGTDSNVQIQCICEVCHHAPNHGFAAREEPYKMSRRLRQLRGWGTGHEDQAARRRSFGSGHRVARTPEQSHRIALLHRGVRAATRSEQMQIAEILSELDFGRREDYGLFLNVHYTALQILEPEWRTEDRDDFSSMMVCLRDDLRALNVLPTRLFLIAPGILNLGNRLGIAYTIRGSRRVARALRACVPSAFAGSYLKLDLDTNWNSFLREVAQMLEDRTVNVRAEDIVQGALIAMQRAAKLFEHALARHHR
jgi:hypothetical protein